MAGINFLGSYSGIDQSTVDQLMEVEKLPLQQLNRKKTDITAEKNAWKDVNTRLNSLYNKMKTLQNSDTHTAKVSKSSDENIVTMSASKNTVPGTYKIKVNQLATNSRVIGGAITLADGKIDEPLNLELDSTKGENYNKITITNDDGDSRDIQVDSGDSLKDIVAKINEVAKDTKDEDGKTIKGTGINATIIDGKIVLTDSEGGNRDINLNGHYNGILTSIGLNWESRDDISGQDANFDINGVNVTRPTNTISDVIEYTTINLNEANIDKEVTINVTHDTSKLTTAIQDFVDQYNSTMAFIDEKTAVGTVTDDGTIGRGDLAGDSALRSLKSSLRRMVTENLGGNTGTSINNLSQLGVATFDKYGQLQFDSSKLNEELEKDPQNVMNFFTYKVDGEEKGFVSKINNYVNSYISSADGLIKSKDESLDKTLKGLNDQIDKFNTRVEKKEQYYINMFSALDVAMMEAESQLSWLSGQISAMNAQTAANK